MNNTVNDPVPVKLTYMERLNLRDAFVKVVIVAFGNSKDEWSKYVKLQEIVQIIQKLEVQLHIKREYATNVATTTAIDKELSLDVKLLHHQQRLDKVHKFYEWASDNGVIYKGLKVEEFPNFQTGLVAERDIKKDDLILRIPRELMLSEENLSPTFLTASNMKLAHGLMLESVKRDSFWKPYFDLLPSTYNTVLYFTVEDMSELKGSNALRSILEFCNTIADLYVKIVYFEKGETKELLNYDLWR